MRRKLITPEGHKKLKDEVDYLWRKERPEITKIVTWAAGLGDRSENADYQYNKRKLREIDRRVRFLRKLLDGIEIVEYHPQQEGKVFFGAWVTLEDDDETRRQFRIVGSEEIYGNDDYISIDSPMAKACLGKQVDDDIRVKTPTGDKVWYILEIEYKPHSVAS
ncbi:transcription elongation factor GreB [Marinomonas epiphytica]